MKRQIGRLSQISNLTIVQNTLATDTSTIWGISMIGMVLIAIVLLLLLVSSTGIRNRVCRKK